MAAAHANTLRTVAPSAAVQLSPADFQAWAAATGNPYPATPQERAAATPAVIAWKQQNQAILAEERGPNALGGVLALAGIGAAGFGGYQLWKNSQDKGSQPAASPDVVQAQADTAALGSKSRPSPYVETPGLDTGERTRVTGWGPDLVGNLTPRIPRLDGTGLGILGSSFNRHEFYKRSGFANDPRIADPTTGEVTEESLFNFLDLIEEETGSRKSALYERAEEFVHNLLTRDQPGASPRGMVERDDRGTSASRSRAKRGDRAADRFKSRSERTGESLVKREEPSDQLKSFWRSDSVITDSDFGATSANKQTVYRLPDGSLKAKALIRRKNGDIIEPLTPEERVLADQGKFIVVNLDQYVRLPDGKVVLEENLTDRQFQAMYSKAKRKPRRMSPEEESTYQSIMLSKQRKDDANQGRVPARKANAVHLIGDDDYGSFMPTQRVDPRDHELFFLDSDNVLRPFMGGERIGEKDKDGVFQPLHYSFRQNPDGGAALPVYYTGQKLDGGIIRGQDLRTFPKADVSAYGYDLVRQNSRLLQMANDASTGVINVPQTAYVLIPKRSELQQSHPALNIVEVAQNQLGKTINAFVTQPDLTLPDEMVEGIPSSLSGRAFAATDQDAPASPLPPLLRQAAAEFLDRRQQHVNTTDRFDADGLPVDIDGNPIDRNAGSFVDESINRLRDEENARAVAKANAALRLAISEKYEIPLPQLASAISALAGEESGMQQPDRVALRQPRLHAEAIADNDRVNGAEGYNVAGFVGLKDNDPIKRIPFAAQRLFEAKQRYEERSGKNLPLHGFDALARRISTELRVDPARLAAHAKAMHVNEVIDTARTSFDQWQRLPEDQRAVTPQPPTAEAVLASQGITPDSARQLQQGLIPWKEFRGERVTLWEDGLVEGGTGTAPRRAADEWRMSHVLYQEKNGQRMPSELSYAKAVEIAKRHHVTLNALRTEHLNMRQEAGNAERQQAHYRQTQARRKAEEAAYIAKHGKKPRANALYALGTEPLEKVFNSLGVHANLGQLATYKLLKQGKVQQVNNSLASLAVSYEKPFKQLLLDHNQSERLNIIAEGIASSVYDLDRFLRQNPDAAVRIGSAISTDNIVFDAYVKSYLRDFLTLKGIVDSPSGIPRFQVSADAVEELAYQARGSKHLSDGIKQSMEKMIADAPSPLAAVRKLNNLTTEAHDNDPNGVADRLAKVVINFRDEDSASDRLLAASPAEIQFSFSSRLAPYEPATAGFWDRNPDQSTARERVNEINPQNLPAAANKRWQGQADALDTKSPTYSSDLAALQEKQAWADKNANAIADAIGDLNRGLITDTRPSRNQVVVRLPINTTAQQAQEQANRLGLDVAFADVQQDGQVLKAPVLVTAKGQARSLGRGLSIGFLSPDPNSPTAGQKVGVLANVEGQAMAMPATTDDEGLTPFDKGDDLEREQKIAGQQNLDGRFDGVTDNERYEGEFVPTEQAPESALQAKAQAVPEVSELRQFVDNVIGEATGQNLPQWEIDRRAEWAIKQANDIAEQRRANNARGKINFKNLGTGQSNPGANKKLANYLYDVQQGKQLLAEAGWEWPLGALHRVRALPEDRLRLAGGDVGTIPLADPASWRPPADGEPVKGAPLSLPQSEPVRGSRPSSTSYTVGRSNPAPDRTMAARLRRPDASTVTPDPGTLDAAGFTQDSGAKAAFLEGFIAARQGITDADPTGRTGRPGQEPKREPLRGPNTLPSTAGTMVYPNTPVPTPPAWENLNREQRVAHAGYVAEFYDKLYKDGLTKNLKPRTPAINRPNGGEFTEPSVATLNARVAGLRRRGII